MFLKSCHKPNTQFVLQNVVNLYAGDIENRKYIDVLDHKYRVTKILPTC